MKTTRDEYIKVVVQAGARRESVRAAKQGMPLRPSSPQQESGQMNISVREPAKGGHANKRVRQLVAEHCGVALGAVRLVGGHHHPHKLFLIRL